MLGRGRKRQLTGLATGLTFLLLATWCLVVFFTHSLTGDDELDDTDLRREYVARGLALVRVAAVCLQGARMSPARRGPGEESPVQL